MPLLGRPRLHLRRMTSTNDRARELAAAGAPHGTLVTADEQTAGRGRMGRRWEAPAGSALLMSLVLRAEQQRQGAPLPLLAGVAVCEAVGGRARVKWPNDVVVEEDGRLRKLGGILAEARPQEGWAVLGVGLNVAVRLDELPAELRASAATLGLGPAAIEPTLASLLAALQRRLAAPVEETLAAWRGLDALYGREVVWGAGASRIAGRAAGVDEAGRLVVVTAEGGRVAVEAGEVLG